MKKIFFCISNLVATMSFRFPFTTSLVLNPKLFCVILLLFPEVSRIETYAGRTGWLKRSLLLIRIIELYINDKIYWIRLKWVKLYTENNWSLTFYIRFRYKVTSNYFLCFCNTNSWVHVPSNFQVQYSVLILIQNFYNYNTLVYTCFIRLWVF